MFDIWTQELLGKYPSDQMSRSHLKNSPKRAGQKLKLHFSFLLLS